MSKLPEHLEIPANAIVLLTGASGSGKSSMINPVLRRMGSPQRLESTEPLGDKRSLIEVYTDHDEGLKVLAAVGLTDASAMARCYSQLSVGQQARDMLGRLILAGGQVLVVDEFLAHLDRLTAKAVAWSVAKALRIRGIGAVLVTANDDIADDLDADLHIQTRWQDDPEVSSGIGGRPCCTVADEIDVVRGDRQDWLAFKPLHYAAGEPATTHSIYTLVHKPTCKPMGVAVYSYPDLHSSARNLATNNRYRQVAGRKAANLLNREVVKLSRLVIAPQVRSIGLAHVLLSESIPRLGATYVECVTAMGRFSSFLERVGFARVPTSSHETEAEWLDWCDRNNPPAPTYIDGPSLLAWVDGLSVRRRREGRRLIWSHYHHFVLHRRTRAKRPKNVANPGDRRWPEAADLASRRMVERPDYYIVGPMDPQTGLPQDADSPGVQAAS